MKPTTKLKQVKYEIRGALARRALEMERQGYEIIKLNVGNPGSFGLRTPETMRQAVIRNLEKAEPYSHQKGIFPAREAVVMQFQDRGIMDVSVENVFMGNGVSELIDLCLRALLEPGDEVLLPSPDYPLWSAATVLNDGVPTYYDCRPENGFVPDPDAVEALIGERTRALVIINPNNPTGAVYPMEVLQRLTEIAERHRLVILTDEIYDRILYDGARFHPMATLAHDTLCVTFSGLSKVYRACGYRVGWAVLSGAVDQAQDYRQALELLAALRLCANVPGQWAVQTALGGHQSIDDLIVSGGSLYDSRQAMLAGIESSPYLDIVAPQGAMYGFPAVNTDRVPAFDDHYFAMSLLERKHVLLVPGSSFNFARRDHFRMTLLPPADVIGDVIERIDELLADYH